MSSVTKRIKEVKQPRGGYVKPSQFTVIKLDDGMILSENENVHASITGMAVDYLVRCAMGEKVSNAFRVPCTGALIAEKMFNQKNAVKTAAKLLSNITTINDKAIISACKLATFDVWRRNPVLAPTAKGPKEINPDKETVRNIEVMIHRSIKFWEDYGPVVQSGFTFSPNGYTSTVDSGDGDYLTADTLWDYKVSKSKPTSKHTLQLLVYWIMGQHSGQKVFNNIKKIGIFNPRLNIIYILDVDTIPKEIISTIERDVICY